LGKNGALRHHEWLAAGPGDPRPAFTRALIDACDGAATIVVYNVTFERSRIEELSEAIPALKRPLAAITKRLVDLLPIVRNQVYHPAFHGKFGIKSVLPALVPALGYEDLAIQEGSSASAALEAMLLDEASLTEAQRKKIRGDLLRYCERDTIAMVRLYQRLLVLTATR
jgi:predicted RecB family nuclease